MLDSPRMLFIDALLLSYRLGYVRHDEEKVALLAALRAATDSMGFLSALETFGIGRRTRLYGFVRGVLAAPAGYRAQYPLVLGLREEGEASEPFLNNVRVLSLVEGVLTLKQQQTFGEAYWWFVRNHESVYHCPKRGPMLGAYAGEPRDNASALLRFEDYLLRLANHGTQRVRERYEGFPADVILAVLRRSFL